MSEGWIEYEGQELPEVCEVEIRVGDVIATVLGENVAKWVGFGAMMLGRAVAQNCTILRYRELIPLHEAEELAREAWLAAESNLSSFEHGYGGFDTVGRLLAEWRERRKGA